MQTSEPPMLHASGQAVGTPVDAPSSRRPRSPRSPRRRLPWLRATAGRLRHVQLVEEGDATAAARVRARWSATGATVVASVANLANTNMGVGMLALPAAMANAGLLGGTVLLLLSGLIAGFGSHLLAECVIVVGRPATLSTITARALGVPGIVLTDAAVVIIGTSCAIGYLIVVGDMLPEIAEWLLGESAVHAGSVLASREIWILISLPIIVPLAFLRRLESLGGASSIVVACVGLTLITASLYALAPATFDPCEATGEAAGAAASELSSGASTLWANASADESDATTTCKGPVANARDLPHTLASFPTFLFAFAAQVRAGIVGAPREGSTPELPLPERPMPDQCPLTTPPPPRSRHVCAVR